MAGEFPKGVCLNPKNPYLLYSSPSPDRRRLLYTPPLQRLSPLMLRGRYVNYDYTLRPEHVARMMLSMAGGRQRFVQKYVGKYHVFGAEEYYFYFGTTPPDDNSPVQETSASLPYTTTATFGDGAQYIAVKKTNGVAVSDFFPIGPNRENYLRIDISSGDEIDGPPQPAPYWHLEQKASGVVRVVGFYAERGTLRGDQWAITVTTDGSQPGSDSPDYTGTTDAELIIDDSGTAKIEFDLPAQAHGTIVSVRVQIRRDDGAGGWIYSETIPDALGQTNGYQTISADAQGPSTPPGGDTWPGVTPEEV